LQQRKAAFTGRRYSRRMTNQASTQAVSRLAGHALVEALIEQGVSDAFGVPSDTSYQRLI